MGKIFLLLLLGLGAALYFPQTRPVVQDTLAPVINPVLTWQTKGEMESIARELQRMNREGRPLPAKGQPFHDWMERNFQGGSSQDAWGNDYSITVWPDSVGVVSNGPDLEVNTSDDIIQASLIQRQRGRR